MFAVGLTSTGRGRSVEAPDRGTSLAGVAADLERAVATLRRQVNAPALRITAPDGRRDDVGVARALYRERAKREAAFPRLHNSQWDMLILLYIGQAEGRRVSVSALCTASYVSATASFRHVTRLIEQGLIERFDDPTDGRRWLVELSQATATTLTDYFARIAEVRAP